MPQDDDSDDEAELKAELERIRAERAAEAEKRAAEEEAKRQEAIRAEVLGGNPLMAGAEVDFGMKRRCVQRLSFCLVALCSASGGVRLL
jgi:protein CWC15